jgi:hypothetical protein
MSEVILKTLAIFLAGFAISLAWAWLSVRVMRVPVWLAFVGAISCGMIFGWLGPVVLVRWIT